MILKNKAFLLKIIVIILILFIFYLITLNNSKSKAIEFVLDGWSNLDTKEDIISVDSDYDNFNKEYTHLIKIPFNEDYIMDVKVRTNIFGKINNYHSNKVITDKKYNRIIRNIKIKDSSSIVVKQYTNNSSWYRLKYQIKLDVPVQYDKYDSKFTETNYYLLFEKKDKKNNNKVRLNISYDNYIYNNGDDIILEYNTYTKDVTEKKYKALEDSINNSTLLIMNKDRVVRKIKI